MTHTLLVSTEELAHHLADPTWLVVDCSFILAKPDEAEQNYLNAHIPAPSTPTWTATFLLRSSPLRLVVTRCPHRRKLPAASVSWASPPGFNWLLMISWRGVGSRASLVDVALPRL